MVKTFTMVPILLLLLGGTSTTVQSWYKPPVNVSWQWQLSGNINISYDVDLYDIDLFDTSIDTINDLKKQGIKVICYFSAGSWENWRVDKDAFPPEVLGKDLDGWPDEKWLDIRKIEILRPIMTARLDLAFEKGCDGVELDNMDAYTNESGFNLQADHQIAYNKLIAAEARNKGLSVGLKNDLDQIVELEPFFDFALNEECHAYDECNKLKPFTNANKPVLNAEYKQEYISDEDSRHKVCAEAKLLGLKTLILPLNLDDSFRISCD